MNYNLLTKDDLISTRAIRDVTETAPSTNASVSTTITLNLDTGKGSELMNKLVLSEMKAAGRKKKLEENKRRADEAGHIEQRLRKATRITSSVIAATGRFSLDETTREAVAERARQKQLQEQQKEDKRKQLQQRQREKYNAAISKEREVGTQITAADKPIIVRYELGTECPNNLARIKGDDLEDLYLKVLMKRQQQPSQRSSFDENNGIDSAAVEEGSSS